MALNKKWMAVWIGALGLAGCAHAPTEESKPLLIHAARVFDGTAMQNDRTVLIENGKVSRVASPSAFAGMPAQRLELGDATLLPGLVELHSHADFHHIPAQTVLRHGITTLRNVGGPLHPLAGGEGELRVLTSGPILTVPEGYPIPQHGQADIAIPVTGEENARQTVRELIDGGAAIIKVALEPGGEAGAPWSSGHGHEHGKHAHAHKPQVDAMPGQWPMLSEPVLKAIVDEAHARQRLVTAHVGEARGAQLALNAGVDEWAHMPCEELPDQLLKQAVSQNVRIVGTLDTLSSCHGVKHNVERWAALGGTLLYGAEIAHPEIPWGIDARELMLMRQWARLSPMQVLQTATADAGKRLGMPLLGTVQAGAPADLIAVRGDVLANFKTLEYPALVISGGKIVLNQFGGNPAD